MFQKLLKCLPINLNCSVYLNPLNFSRAMWPRGKLSAHCVTLMGRFLAESRWLPHHTVVVIKEVHSLTHAHTHVLGVNAHTNYDQTTHTLRASPVDRTLRSLNQKTVFNHSVSLKSISLLMLLSTHYQSHKRSMSAWSTQGKKKKKNLVAATWALIQMERDAAWWIPLSAHLMKWDDNKHSLWHLVS